MRWVAALLFVGTMGFVPPKLDTRIEIAGVYTAVGVHPDGSTYAGKATLTRLSLDRYAIRFDMPNGVFRALCVRSKALLGCAWGSASTVAAVVIRNNVATWARDGDDALGREVLSADLSGIGTDPAGAEYTSNWHFASEGALERITWTKQNNTVVGWGLRTGAVVIAGFPMPAAGAAFYRIEANGTVLAGEWMDPMVPDAGRGNETLTR